MNCTPKNLLTDDHLRAQVKLLGTLLGQVLLQFAGEDVFEAVETLRAALPSCTSRKTSSAAPS